MPTTSNFGWTTPADTDLVKDGAAAIRTLGNGIDTSLVDLKGGTTGQILSKASNTDLDYTWIANDQGDITEVQAGTGISVASGTGPVPVVTNTVATTFDAKGDLVVGTGADTFAKLAAGTNNYKIVADSSTSTGLAYQGFIGAFCRKNASQTLTTSTLGAITWQTEIFDTNNIHSTVTDTDRFTIPTGLGGYWLISASITFDASTSGGRRLYLFKNGSGGTSIATLRTGAFTNDYLNLQCTAIVSCVPGDYLTISGWQSSGGNLVVFGDNLGNDVSWISVAYLGA